MGRESRLANGYFGSPRWVEYGFVYHEGLTRTYRMLQGVARMKRLTLNGLPMAIAFALVCIAHASVVAAEPVAVLSVGAVTNARQPQAAVGDDGAIYVAFGADDSVYCSTSTDGGVTYGDAVKVGTVDRLALGMRRGPRIAAGGKSVVITAVSHANGKVLAWRTADRGSTWSSPVLINDNPEGTANEGLHALAAAPDGSLYCVWLDHRLERKNQIFGAASADGGATWSENRLVYQSPGGSVCECCHPAATFDREGKLFVMWRNSLNGFRDMYFATSTDGGKTFREASKLGSGSWKLNACPMDGGYLAASESGQVTTIWRRERQVVQADSSGGERLIAIGEQPWAASDSEGVWFVWLGRRGGDLWLASPGEDQPTWLSGGATDPVLAAAGGGKGSVVVVWEAGAGQETRIMASVVNK